MTSTKTKARIAGSLYVLFAALGPFVLLYVPSALVSEGNPAATAARIATHETLLRLGIAGDLAGGLLALVVSLALYWLFEKVDTAQAVLLVILGGILPCAIYFLNSLNWFAALALVHGDAVMPAFVGPQRDELVMLFMRLHHDGVVVSLVFAGLWLFPFAVLIIKSRFIPVVLGWWLVANGFAYLATTATGLLAPRYADLVATIATPIQFGEVAVLLWLLIMGAREPAP